MRLVVMAQAVWAAQAVWVAQVALVVLVVLVLRVAAMSMVVSRADPVNPWIPRTIRGVPVMSVMVHPHRARLYFFSLSEPWVFVAEDDNCLAFDVRH